MDRVKEVLGNETPLFDPLGAWQRTRTGNPDTSLEAAAAVQVTKQAHQVLTAYSSGEAITDHEAYARAGFSSERGQTRQRCSDLRREELIKRTGERGRAPSGRAAYKCTITDRGRAFLKTLEP